jgi:hypothetical protein
MDALTSRTFFVTSESTSICPTREQAELRECGNSVEFFQEGLVLSRGEDVTIVGDAPFDGHWRAIRYQLDGPMPSWIRADDVGEQPDLSAQQEFTARDDVVAARSIDSMSARALRRLESGTLVRFTARRDIRLAAIGPMGTMDMEGTVIVYVPLGRKYVAVGLLESIDELGPESWPWARRHRCLADGDCISLSYRCDETGADSPSYCDEVSILAYVTPMSAPPPEDPENEWPRAARDHMPFLVGVALVDRFGVHEFRTPVAMEGWH